MEGGRRAAEVAPEGDAPPPRAVVAKPVRDHREVKARGLAPTSQLVHYPSVLWQEGCFVCRDGLLKTKIRGEGSPFFFACEPAVCRWDHQPISASSLPCHSIQMPRPFNLRALDGRFL